MRLILFGIIFGCMTVLFLNFADGAFAMENKSGAANYQKIFKTQKHKNLFSALVKEGFTKIEIEDLFSDKDFKIYPKIITGGKQLSFEEYKKIILSEESIKKGIKFMLDNKLVFDLSQKKYGIAKEDLAAILRVETNFGYYGGKYKVFNSLYSIYHHSNVGKKMNWAKGELIVFLKIAKKNNFNPYDISGSWAGAFGLVQFIPSSYLDFAVDGDGDKKIDLFDIEDAVMSAANYLCKHGYAKSREKAFYSYNHSESYVKILVLYAEALKKYKKSVLKQSAFLFY